MLTYYVMHRCKNQCMHNKNISLSYSINKEILFGGVSSFGGGAGFEVNTTQ